MEFNGDKSYVMEMGKSARRPVGIYKMGDGVELEKVKKEKDFGEMMEENNQPRCVETWNSLSEEVVSAKSVHSFKEKLNKCRYGDGATRA
ncbi:hypothetical protein E2C01_043469 [Portunus trituberculatus]|uniref:Uncharacterized protein n=1 Tax=Portunus trituberculatus TaxID=210409 RepID=A0A5B7FWT2_PORTR|nr:hypothetical protein [Portunus trituberculatus]